MFKDIRLHISKKQFNSYVDSLITNDQAFNVVNSGDRLYCEFTEKSEFGKDYKGYLLMVF